MAKGWSREFDDPVELPKGKPLMTLCDALHHQVAQS
jgi:hypothetical protein